MTNVCMDMIIGGGLMTNICNIQTDKLMHKIHLAIYYCDCMALVQVKREAIKHWKQLSLQLLMQEYQEN